MKIISYNVNGIRASIKKGLIFWIQKYNPDIICLQEIRAYTTQININLFQKIGYYNYWFPSQKAGYSGVAILTKIKPKKINYGIGLSDIDREGRMIRLDFNNFSIISLYIPSGTNLVNRFNFKLKFMNYFFQYIKQIKINYPNLIISGDYNISHQNIDIHNPNINISGFLPIERNWMSNFINYGFIDSFRFLYKNLCLYSWWSYKTKAKLYNKGWRIDYHMVSNSIKNHIKNSDILTNIEYSDHCPILLDINL